MEEKCQYNIPQTDLGRRKARNVPLANSRTLSEFLYMRVSGFSPFYNGMVVVTPSGHCEQLRTFVCKVKAPGVSVVKETKLSP